LMSKVLSAIKSGFGGILRFNGRISRTDFWIYSIFVSLLAFGIWSSVMSLEMARTFGEVQQYANANPEKVTITTSSTSYSVSIKDGAPGVGPDFKYLLKWISGIAVAAIALLAAAAARRLHDSNRTGLWVLLPLPFLFSGLWLMNSVFSEFNSPNEPSMSLFAFGFINNFVYLATLGFVAFLLLRSGSTGENRFGNRAIEDAS
jgi:uncharacterized membrane protein YhaH (DUF805 family)